MNVTLCISVQEIKNKYFGLQTKQLLCFKFDVKINKKNELKIQRKKRKS